MQLIIWYLNYLGLEAWDLTIINQMHNFFPPTISIDPWYWFWTSLHLFCKFHTTCNNAFFTGEFLILDIFVSPSHCAFWGEKCFHIFFIVLWWGGIHLLSCLNIYVFGLGACDIGIQLHALECHPHEGNLHKISRGLSVNNIWDNMVFDLKCLPSNRYYGVSIHHWNKKKWEWCAKYQWP